MTDSSSSAPETTKNSSSTGGVQRSHRSITTAVSAPRLQYTAPIIMHSSRELRFSLSASAMPSSTAVRHSISRLAREWKKRMPTASSSPIAPPMVRESTISTTGSISIFFTVSALPLAKVRASASEMAKTISPTASSMATTGRSVEVSGPLARY